MVARGILGYLPDRPENLDFVHVRAGTGIWTRQAAALGFRSVHAIEPNDDMRDHGLKASLELPIK